MNLNQATVSCGCAVENCKKGDGMKTLIEIECSESNKPEVMKVLKVTAIKSGFEVREIPAKEYGSGQMGDEGVKTLRKIVRDKLIEMGAEGLCGNSCGCRLDDLMPCDNPEPDCEAAKACEPTKEEKAEWGDITFIMHPIG